MNPEKRLLSLDALRGFDMLFIMGLSSFIAAVCALFPEGSECALAQNMSHVSWDGFRHHDTIFPLFLFIAGISFPFSYAKQLSAGASRRKIYLKIFKRAAVLILLGLVVNGLFKFHFDKLRVASVLGRIGLAWMFAAGLLWSLDFPLNKKLWSSSFVLVVGAYSLLMFALFYYIIDVKGCTGWTFPFKVVGMNSITIYIAQSVIGFSGIAGFFLSGVTELCSEPWANVVNKLGYMIVCWLFLYFLYRKKVFLKV